MQDIEHVDSRNKDPSIYLRHNLSQTDQDIASDSAFASLVAILHLMIFSSSHMASNGLSSVKGKSKRLGVLQMHGSPSHCLCAFILVFKFFL